MPLDPKLSLESAPSRRLWTVKEAAAALGVSVRTIWRLVSTAQLEVVRIGRRCVRIPAASVDALIQRGGAP
jgi:excisionase family DNA binding protein